MHVRKRVVIALAGSLLCSASCTAMPESWPIGAPVRFEGMLSLLTYNVKGGPWPAARGRAPALAAIGDRLRAMRDQGRNPAVVVLQEAFTADAKAIARRAGYRYVVEGPSAAERDPAVPAAGDAAFLAGARWWKGELGIRLVDSGLVLMSDYPVTRIRRIAYPDEACAGFDCLANKGALLVTLQPPQGAPVDIVTTHLNSRRSSAVPDARSLYAYRRQADILEAFVTRWRDPSHPLIVAGDLNAGNFAPRDSSLRAAMGRLAPGGRAVTALDTAIGALVRHGRTLTHALQTVARHDTDWQLYYPGTSARLVPVALSVPHDLGPTAQMLSDHVGYSVTFRLLPSS